MKDKLKRILKEKRMTVHPDADMFPMLGVMDMSGLARDIKKNGLREAITARGKEIWDGRNELVAWCGRQS